MNRLLTLVLVSTTWVRASGTVDQACLRRRQTRRDHRRPRQRVEGLGSPDRGHDRQHSGLQPARPGESKLPIIQRQLDRVAEDSSVKALVLRIDSPGGTVTGSDAIHELVQRFRVKTNQPVFASVQEVGASGAD